VDARSGAALAADARVDNRAELAGLLGAGRLPVGRAPTGAELILAAYGRWGEGCAGRLVGDFAFALWDPGRGRLFAARDAMGMRPLYYRLEAGGTGGGGGRLLFATEAKQLLAAAGGAGASPFEPAIGAHLVGCFGPLDWSFYEGVSQLPPAHALSFGDGGLKVWRHWEADPQRRVVCASEEEYAERFLWVFGEAVRCRLGDRRPAGLMLSGGVDSGSIASVGGRLVRGGEVRGAGLRAYSWAFGGGLSGADERGVSSRIAGHYGIPVREVAAAGAWPLAGYPRHGPDRDDPLIWVYQPLIEKTLAAAREEGMGTVLSGDRGDEMVGDWIFDLPGMLRAGRAGGVLEDLRELGRWTGLPLREVAKGYLLRPFLATLWPQGTTEWLRRPLRGTLGRPHPRAPYPGWLRPEFARRIGLDEIVRSNEDPHSNMRNPARRRRYQLIFAYMHMRGVVWSNRTWARFGLGFADPWSDRRLAELVLAMPQWRVQRPAEPKGIARRAMRGVMPEDARRCVGKIEPVSLFDRGFKDRSRETVMDLITNSQAAARGYLDEDALRRRYLSFLRGEPQPFDFWWALTLEMWLRRYWA